MASRSICAAFAISLMYSFLPMSDAFAGRDRSKDEESLKKDFVETELYFFSSRDAADMFQTLQRADQTGTKLEPEIWQGKAEDEKRVLKACGAEEPVEVMGLPAAAAIVIEPVIKWIVGKIDDRLQEEIKANTAAYAASARVESFYAEGSTPARPALANSCFRLTRRERIDERVVVALDFVGQMQIANGEVLQVRPLRLFVGKSKAKKQSDKPLGLAMKMEADAIWRSGAQGKQAADVLVFESLVSEKIETLPLYKVYLSPDRGKRREDWDFIPWSRTAHQPLLPWSTYEGVEMGGSYANFTVSVAEVSEPTWVLEKIRRALP